MEAFRKLGFGASFDLKRFRNDAATLKLFERLPSIDQENQARSGNNDAMDDVQTTMKVEHRRSIDKNGRDREFDDDEGDDQPEFRLTKEIVARNGGDESVSSKGRTKRKKKEQAAIRKQRKLEEIAHFRKRNKIYVWGSDIPEPSATFDAIIAKYKIVDGLAEVMRESLAAWTPTPIQMQAIPLMLEGRETLASAPTGSGKTLAFLLPLMHHLRKPKRGGFRAVIIEPTRELAKQVYQEVQRFNEKLGLRAHMISKPEIAREKFGPDSKRRFDILITTPNRLVHMLAEDPPCLDLTKVEWLIVDESDKLFEFGHRGFREQLAKIYRACDGPKCRRAFFSATFSYDVEQWCKTYLDNMAMVSIGARNTAVETVHQELTFVGSEYGKLVALRNLIREGLMPPVLIFVQSKERAQQLFTEMLHDKHKVEMIHSGRERKEREKAVRRFRKGDVWFLICTELMGRGIDFKNVNVVINYDFPLSAISYIHRIGRTGRAGRKGRAITFFTEQDRPLLRSIANVMREAGCPTPDYLLQMKKPSKRSQARLARQCSDRPNIRIVRTTDYRGGRKRKASESASKQSPSNKRRKTDQNPILKPEN